MFRCEIRDIFKSKTEMSRSNSKQVNFPNSANNDTYANLSLGTDIDLVAPPGQVTTIHLLLILVF